MRVMLDNSIPGHSQLCDWVMGPQGPLFGAQSHCEVVGVVRKKAHDDVAFQAQVDMLFTVGRLIREKRIDAFNYSELRCESMQQFIGERMLDALAECNIQTCPPAIERSRFQRGNYFAFARKGGEKDRKRGLDARLSQIAFMQMLCGLGEGFLPQWTLLKDPLGLTDFEIESLKNLKCFQQFCKISNSAEHYPDMFHLWTAQRNHMEVFLTLDNKLANIAKMIHKSRGISIKFPTQVLRPSELLSLFGVKEPDPIPIRHGSFYTLQDLWSDAPTQRFALFRVSQR
jgi:hypothetical protein